eukprot:CAMPEP_0177770050 /NCGR_PEP_ID=MMETSP0491_2-20121128/10698_1 /TAXON_ID=63592 /ORGANISM="Tetraselmis chuii, Strain PLY429" /LENGTH=222 /DNA_ID=CAMNT_0019287199 /DNA_START=243 /DNA_END=911 /DNA_ORIENTATION=-
MADDWEDWEDDSFVPPSVTAAVGNAPVKFADEDEEEEDLAAVEKPKPKAKTKQPAEKGGKGSYDEPLDDPVAEKLRQQRLVEEADFAAVKDLFGTDRSLDTFIPKSAKEFDEFARMLAHKYLLPHADSSHYKSLLKSLNKVALVSMTAQETKDVETCLAGIRTDKLKAEREAVKEKKDIGKKKGLNFGRGGTGKAADNLLGADVDEYLDDGALDVDDDYDFM